MEDNYVQIDATLLGNVHNQNKCAPDTCVIHNPSDHHMRGWTSSWNDITVTMWRICPHGLLHIDPDELLYQRKRFGDAQAAGLSVHTCDGCCQPPPVLIPAPVQRGDTVSVEPQ